jgi:hypothetical protein
VKDSFDDADDVEDGEVEPLGLLDPFGSPPGHELEPDPDFFPQENSFYWHEFHRRQAGLPPTELFRLEMTTEFSIVDLGAFSRWAIKNADRARDLQFMEGEGENGEDVLVASYDSVHYAVSDAWEVSGASLLILEGWGPPGSVIQSSSWALSMAEEPDRTRQEESSAFVVTMKANVGVVDLAGFHSWMREVGDVEPDTDRAANALSPAGQALWVAVDRVFPRLAPPGIALRSAEWSLAQIDGDTPPTWD